LILDIQLFKNKIEDTISSFRKDINNRQPSELYSPIDYTLQLGGKRLRPMLLLMANNLFDGDIEQALQPALGIEVFHNFTLLHDDIMDNAPLRRGNPTVHSKWNQNIAILSGDTMFVESCKLVMKTRQDKIPEILSIFWQCAIEVCEGQQWDMNFEKKDQVSIDQYTRMIMLKTAVLLAGSLKIGAITAGAAPEDAASIYAFGKHCGIAFQLQDDILDVYGESVKFGKQPGGDIVANKKTYLLLKAIELAKGYTKEDLQYWMFANDIDQNKKIEAVKQIYDFLGVRKLAENAMQEHFDEGIKFLESLPCNEAKKNILKEFSYSLIEREI
jgi:geranylgeranyl diphosphate synthase, type II